MTDKLKSAPTFFSSGSTMLDKIVGGGWALGRVFNLVGDKSTGKTLIAIEAFANFERRFPNGKMRYAEAESAFDDVYADVLGFPAAVQRPEEMLHTVEEFRDDFNEFIEERIKAQAPGLYILDSLDSLSDDAEVKSFEKKKDGEEDKGSYGTGKAKKMTQLFRLLTQKAGKADVSLGIVSQIRDRIGVTFGETKMRTGGHALDFYASQIVWLHEVSKLTRTAKGQDRVVGLEILAKCKKCKVGFPFREAEMDLIFGYGMDDEISMLKYLKSVSSIDKDAFAALKKKLDSMREAGEYANLEELAAQLRLDVNTIWNEVDLALAPMIRKYRPIMAPPLPLPAKVPIKAEAAKK